MNCSRKIVESEKEALQEDELYIKNYEKCLKKEDDFSISILKQRKDEEKQHKELEKRIENSKKEIENTATMIVELKNEINELKNQHSNIEMLIRDSNIQIFKSNKNENILDTLRKTHKFINHKLKLYEEYLGCTITFHEPDVYIFSFSLENINATVKFRFCNSDWTVLDYEPKNVFTDEDLKEFESIRDTQKLLANLMNN